MTTRVKQYSPQDSQVAISGYLVVGGISGGFAFDRPEFFLNLAHFDDFDIARVVMAHELYHAVQNAYAPQQHAWWHEKDAQEGRDRALAQQCSTTYDYFDALYKEGTASSVGDPFLLRDAKGIAAKKMLGEMDETVAHLGNSAILLELSITGLDAPNPVPFDEVYAVGFYLPETVYKLGYAMAKAIVTGRGDQA